MTPPLTPSPETCRCVECLRLFHASEVMHLGDAAVCAECKPGAVAKIAQDTPLGTFWRNGMELVAVRKGPWIELPPRCVLCDAPSGERWVTRNAIWMRPVLWLTLLLTPVVFLIVLLAVGYRVGWRYSFCEVHWRRHDITQRVLGVMLGVGGGTIVLGFGQHLRWAMCIGIATVVATVTFIAFGHRELRSKRHTATHSFFKGCCREFLAELPEWPGAR